MHGCGCLPTAPFQSIWLAANMHAGIAQGARRAFEELPDRAERERWLRIPFTGVDGLPMEGKAWVDQGILAATVVSLTTTQVALQMVIRALGNGVQPPLRTLIELASYPALEHFVGKSQESSRGKMR